MVKLDYARLKNIRLEQDITQKELATATGVNLSTIKQIETGRSATDLENIEKLCGSRHQRNLPPRLPRHQGALHAQQQGRLR